MINAMSLLDSLENLRQSSVEKRRVVLIILVTIGMAAAIGIWVLQLQYTAPNYKSTESPTKPFAFLSGSARDAFGALKENLKSLYERK
jgi:hypothetical protein